MNFVGRALQWRRITIRRTHEFLWWDTLCETRVFSLCSSSVFNRETIDGANFSETSSTQCSHMMPNGSPRESCHNSSAKFCIFCRQPNYILIPNVVFDHRRIMNFCAAASDSSELRRQCQNFRLLATIDALRTKWSCIGRWMSFRVWCEQS